MDTLESNTITVMTPLKAKKKYNLTPTPRQRKAARIIVDVALGLRPDIKNQGDIVIESGYSPTVQEVPHKVLNTSGVNSALDDLGFNAESAKRVVKQILEDIKAKHNDRLKAADMVFKVAGTYAAEKQINVNIDANIDNTALMALAQRMRDTTR